MKINNWTRLIAVTCLLAAWGMGCEEGGGDGYDEASLEYDEASNELIRPPGTSSLLNSSAYKNLISQLYYAEWKVIAELPEKKTSCPTVSGFYPGLALYPSDHFILKSNYQHCLYERSSATKNSDEIFGPLVTNGTFSAFQRTSFLLGTETGLLPTSDAGKDLFKAVAPSMQEAFRKWAGRPNNLPNFNYSRVRVAVIDTSPSALGLAALTAVGTAPHGQGVANLIADMVCKPGVTANPVVCAATIQTVLATGTKNYNQNSTTQKDSAPGVVGSNFDLVYALIQTATEFAKNRGAANYHMIINLSLALAPFELGSANLNGLSIPLIPFWYAALTDALTYARCHGALIIAAAGNRPFGEDDAAQGGARYPASLMDELTITYDQCKQLYCDPADDSTCKVYQSDFPARNAPAPVVYAVSAVDASGKPLAGNSTRSVTSIMAYGDHAVAKIRQPTPTDPNRVWAPVITGTSASAAVATAAAALVWQYNLNLSPDSVMSQLKSTGLPMTNDGKRVLADICLRSEKDLAGKCPQATIISACEAVASACVGGSSPCPSGDPFKAFQCIPRSFGRPDAMTQLPAPSKPIAASLECSTEAPSAGGWWGAPLWRQCKLSADGALAEGLQFTGVTSSSNPAAFFSASATTSVNTQPGSVSCSVCFLTNSRGGEAIINIADECGNEKIGSDVSITTNSGGISNVRTVSLTGGTTTTVQTGTADSATITATTASGKNCTSALYVTN